jgi:hypothetical protein
VVVIPSEVEGSALAERLSNDRTRIWNDDHAEEAGSPGSAGPLCFLAESAEIAENGVL